MVSELIIDCWVVVIDDGLVVEAIVEISCMLVVVLELLVVEK